MPSISVIVPVYQAEKFLHRCLDSVARQTFSDWELILVNDGSTDGSAALCDRFAAKDSRVRVFHRKKNQGVSEARNLGLNEAKGAYDGTVRNEIITIVDKHEYQKLMQYVTKEDPAAFITVYNVSDMRYIPKGRGQL